MIIIISVLDMGVVIVLMDFLSLESFFGYKSAALFLEEIQNRYSHAEIKSAFSKGYLERRRICIGPDCGRYLCWLSDKGRCEAKKSISA